MTDNFVAIPKGNNGEEIRVQKGDFNGRPIVHVRQYFTADDGSKRPTKKGVAFHPDMLPAIVEALSGLLPKELENPGDEIPG